MKIRVLVSCAGKYEGKSFSLSAGDVVEVDEKLAATLVAANYAEYVDKPRKGKAGKGKAIK